MSAPLAHRGAVPHPVASPPVSEQQSGAGAHLSKTGPFFDSNVYAGSDLLSLRSRGLDPRQGRHVFMEALQKRVKPCKIERPCGARVAAPPSRPTECRCILWAVKLAPCEPHRNSALPTTSGGDADFVPTPPFRRGGGILSKADPFLFLYASSLSFLRRNARSHRQGILWCCPRLSLCQSGIDG